MRYGICEIRAEASRGYSRVDAHILRSTRDDMRRIVRHHAHALGDSYAGRFQFTTTARIHRDGYMVAGVDHLLEVSIFGNTV